MSLTITGIYENGVIKPLQSIDLPEGTHVFLEVKIIAEAKPKQSPAEILAEITALPPEDLDAEASNWLAAPGEDLPPYDWGEQGVPQGKQVHYVPGVGLVVEGGKSLAYASEDEVISFEETLTDIEGQRIS